MRKRTWIAALGLVGMGEALYMLAYTVGWIDHLWCPLFGSGCDRVGRSKQATHFGVPNSAAGAAYYATTTTLALLPQKRLPTVTLGATSALDAVLCLKAIEHSLVPPTAGLLNLDPACAVHARNGDPLRANVRLALTTSVGFWGNNACLVFERID